MGQCPGGRRSDAPGSTFSQPSSACSSSGQARWQHPEPAYAGTATTIEARILSLVNAARENCGRAPLRLRASLVDFAGDRAAKMASSGVLKHPRCLPCLLDQRDIPYSTYGETIAPLPVGQRGRSEAFQDLEEQPAPLGDPDERELRPHRNWRRQTQQRVDLGRSRPHRLGVHDLIWRWGVKSRMAWRRCQTVVRTTRSTADTKMIVPMTLTWTGMPGAAPRR